MQRIRNSGPLVWITLGWAVGLVVGRSLGGPAGIYFTIAMAGALAGAGLYKWPKRAAVGWVMALIAAGGGWWTIRCTSDPLNLGPTEQRLIRVEGTIDQPPTFRLESGGLFGRFDHRPPATRLALQVDRIHDGQTWRPIHTRLLVTIGEYDDRFSSGDRIRCGGRLRAIGPPLNPGQFDYARHLADRGVGGQLYLKRRSHVHRIDTVPKPLWTSARHAAATSAHAALHEGIDTQSRSSEALLDMLLLGTGREDLGELDDAFAKTGLAHLLAISGLHIGILAVGLWWGTLLLCGRPQAAATVAIAGVLIYLFLVPTRVPIMRAGLMTVFAMAATGHGRRIHPLSLLSVAALISRSTMPWI
jgi:competence protein ComEC